jgi:hypothetical protein
MALLILPLPQDTALMPDKNARTTRRWRLCEAVRGEGGIWSMDVFFSRFMDECVERRNPPVLAGAGTSERCCSSSVMAD